MTEIERAIKTAIMELRDTQIRIELLILRIPTGERRNLLTEANIHMSEALQKLRRLQ
jgi:hypothetical protein